MKHPYIPKGCDQQGRYPEAAEAATDVGADDAPEAAEAATDVGVDDAPEPDIVRVVLIDIALWAVVIAVIAVIALIVMWVAR